MKTTQQTSFTLTCRCQFLLILDPLPLLPLPLDQSPESLTMRWIASVLPELLAVGPCCLSSLRVLLTLLQQLSPERVVSFYHNGFHVKSEYPSYWEND